MDGNNLYFRFKPLEKEEKTESKLKKEEPVDSKENKFQKDYNPQDEALLHILEGNMKNLKFSQIYNAGVRYTN